MFINSVDKNNSSMYSYYGALRKSYMCTESTRT